jgi:hypothetical protein
MAWAKRNPERIAAIKRRYNETHREENAAYNKTRKMQNSEHVREMKRNWAKNNHARAMMQRVRVRLKALGVPEEVVRMATADQYQRIFTDQHGGCAICGAHHGNTVATRLCIDHNHVTGELRGLLCRRCNTAIGYFGDSSAIIKHVIAYLKLHAEYESDEAAERRRKVLEALAIDASTTSRVVRQKRLGSRER